MANQRGRKDKYYTNVEPRLEEIKNLARFMTEKELCAVLDVAPSTFANYKNDHPELRQVMLEGRTSLINDLKETMIQRALGYNATEKKTTTEKLKFTFKQKAMLKALGYTDADLDVHVVHETESVKHYPADVNALNRLLLNYDKTWLNDPSATDIKQKELKIKELQAKKAANQDADEWEPMQTGDSDVAE